MKMSKILVLLFLGFGQTSLAGIDQATKDRLIEKFTKVYNQIADEEEAKVNVTLRLADLLAEKGRDEAKTELEQGCTICSGGEASRKKALNYYAEAVRFLKADRKASVLIQMGHLNEVLGQSSAAIQNYGQVLAATKNPKLTSEANFSLAELYFKQRRFAQAAPYYQKVVNAPKGEGRKGFSAYRGAWCAFNMGQYQKGTQALVNILNSPKLLTRGADSSVISVDESFKGEVTRDLVVFIVKRGYQSNDFNTIYKLGRKESRLDDLSTLAEELERLGEIDNAVDVWNKLLGKIKDPVQKWEGLVRYANLLRENGRVSESLKAYNRALSFGSSQGNCQSDTCDEIRIRERKYVLDWHKASKKSVSDDLAKAYETYNNYNKDRADMAYWGAEVNVERKNLNEAFKGYGKAISLYSKTKAKTDKRKKELAEMYEASLLKRIEIAEEKEFAQVKETYEQYLKLSKEQEAADKVRYQLAKLAYDKEDYLKSHEMFVDYAIKTKSNDKEIMKLREQAADLALDALVLAKREDRLIKTAEKLAEALPQKAKDYQAIVRKAVINQSFELAKSDKNNKNNKKALTLLKRADFSGATEKEKETVLKNKIILAEKLGHISEARGYINQYLGLSTLDKKERQFAYKKKAWLSELMFDFKSALAATKKIDDIKEPQRTLQLALLTDLAGGDSQILFRNYIAKNPKSKEAPEMALDLVKNSKTPWQTFKSFSEVLKSKPGMWKEALLVAYGQKASLAELQNYMKWDDKSSKFTIDILQTQLLKPIIAEKSQVLASMSIDSSDQNKMSKDIQARMDAIEKYETFVSKVLNSGLWFGQVYALQTLAKESDRFYQEVMGLPMPEGLTPQEQNQYMNLLAQSAAPYQAKFEQINNKLNEIWNEKKSVKNAFADLDQEPEWMQKLWVAEYQALSDMATPDFNTFVDAQIADFQQGQVVAVEESVEVPLNQMMKLKSKVMSDPFDKNILGELLDIEKQRKQDKMVIYLEQRMAKLKQIKSGVKK